MPFFKLSKKSRRKPFFLSTPPCPATFSPPSVTTSPTFPFVASGRSFSLSSTHQRATRTCTLAGWPPRRGPIHSWLVEGCGRAPTCSCRRASVVDCRQRARRRSVMRNLLQLAKRAVRLHQLGVLIPFRWKKIIPRAALGAVAPPMGFF